MSILDNLSNSTFVQDIVRGAMTNLDLDIDNTITERMLQATSEVPHNLAIYEEIGRYYGIDNIEDLNTAGLIDGDISFYKYYLQSNILNYAIENKSKKVIGVSDKYNRGDINLDFDYRHLIKIQTTLGLYGHCLINMLNVGNVPDELEYEIIEPYRFTVYEDGNGDNVYKVYIDEEYQIPQAW